MVMKRILIIGLGNPGKEYEKTRHNVGFMAIDAFIDGKNLSSTEKFNGEIFKIKQESKEIIFVKPLTYMNNSGICVSQIVNFYKIETSNILVIHDDMDLKLGEVRFRIKGSSGGHNGIKSIISMLGTQDFKRIKIGIGKPDEITTVDYVLGKFSKKEKTLIDEATGFVNRFLKEYIESNESNAFDKTISKIANEVK